jgi:tRNA threonylcarbamoyl adenosine modification protein YeaZ
MSAWFLGFDASTPRCVIAVGRIDVDRGHTLVVADDEDEPVGQASARLVPRLQEALRTAGIEPSALQAIGCGRGPGTFTGTRVAVATAKGLALGLGRPILPISTLAALAASAATEGAVLPLLDARRGEVYGAVHHCHLHTGSPRVERQGEERCAPVSEILQGAITSCPGATVVAVGPGVEAYAEALPVQMRGSAQAMPGPTAQGFWLALVSAHARGAMTRPENVEAVYLRQSYAELGIAAPKRPFSKSPFV